MRPPELTMLQHLAILERTETTFSMKFQMVITLTERPKQDLDITGGKIF